MPLGGSLTSSRTSLPKLNSARAAGYAAPNSRSTASDDDDDRDTTTNSNVLSSSNGNNPNGSGSGSGSGEVDNVASLPSQSALPAIPRTKRGSYAESNGSFSVTLGSLAMGQSDAELRDRAFGSAGSPVSDNSSPGANSNDPLWLKGGTGPGGSTTTSGTSSNGLNGSGGAPGASSKLRNNGTGNGAGSSGSPLGLNKHSSGSSGSSRTNPTNKLIGHGFVTTVAPMTNANGDECGSSSSSSSSNSDSESGPGTAKRALTPSSSAASISFSDVEPLQCDGLAEAAKKALVYLIYLGAYQLVMASVVVLYFLFYSYLPFYTRDGELNESAILGMDVVQKVTVSAAVCFALAMNTKRIPRILYIGAVVLLLMEIMIQVIGWLADPDYFFAGHYQFYALLVPFRVGILILLVRKHFEVSYGWKFVGAFINFTILAYSASFFYIGYFLTSSATSKVLQRILLFPIIEKASYYPAFMWVRSLTYETGVYIPMYPWIVAYRLPYIMLGRFLVVSLDDIWSVVLVVVCTAAIKLVMRVTFKERLSFLLGLRMDAREVKRYLAHHGVNQFFAHNIETMMTLEKVSIVVSAAIYAFFYRGRHYADMFYSSVGTPVVGFIVGAIFLQLIGDLIVDYVGVTFYDNRVFHLSQVRDVNWFSKTYWLNFISLLLFVMVGGQILVQNFITVPLATECETRDYCSCDYALAKSGDCPGND